MAHVSVHAPHLFHVISDVEIERASKGDEIKDSFLTIDMFTNKQELIALKIATSSVGEEKQGKSNRESDNC